MIMVKKKILSAKEQNNQESDDNDPNTKSFIKAIKDFERVKILPNSPRLTPAESVQIKEILGSSHMVFNYSNDDEKIAWIKQKLDLDD